MSIATAELTGQYKPGLQVRERVGTMVPSAAGLLVGALLWEVVGRLWDVAFFPPLSAVLVRLGELTAEDKIVKNLAGSLVNLAIAFTFSVVVGITLGVLMGAFRKVDMALDVYVYALLTAPSLVFAPVFFAVFGLKAIQLTILSIIILYCIWIIVVNTASAIRSVPIALVEMGRSYCATERQLFFKIILPASMPMIFAGLRLGMGRAVKGMINGEMFIVAVGLGGVAKSEGQRFNAEGVLAVLLVIVIVALVMSKLVQLLDARVTSWLPSTARQGKRRVNAD